MKTFVAFIFIPFLLINAESHAQRVKTQLDSLHYVLANTTSDTQRIVLLNELAYIHLIDQPQQALQYSQQALAIAQKIGHQQGIQTSQKYLLLLEKILQKQNNQFYLYIIGVLMLSTVAYFFFRNNTKENLISEQVSDLQAELEQVRNELYEKEEQLKHQREEFDALHNDLENKIKERTMELQSAAENLLQRNKDLEEFSYIVSHNLRAPVANMLGLTSLFKNPQMQEEQRKELFPYLEDSAKRLDTTIKDLSEVLSIRNNAMKSREQVNLNEMINFIKKSLKNEIKEYKAEIITDFSQADTLYTVKAYLESILYNLLSNAIKYSSPTRTPQVKLKTYVENGYTCLSISDNGLGIDLKSGTYKIFGLYQRMHTHTEGKGFGLYLVQTQVESLNGKIEVESEVGVGSTFRVYFRNE
jgi:signal transduction histidine kinase